MIINLSPQVRDDILSVRKNGDILIINGRSIDFSPLEEGASISSNAVDCEFVVGDITRENGELQITLLLPISWDSGEDSKFPKTIVSPKDGIIKLPGGVK